MSAQLIINAAKCNDFDELKRLMEKGGNSTTVKKDIAFIAASKNYLDMLKYVVTIDPLFLIKGHYRNCKILRKALQGGALDIVKYMIENPDAKVLDKHVSDFTPSAVHQAIRNGHLPILKYFIEERQVDADKPPNNQNPLIFQALNHKRQDIVQYLIDERRVNLTILDKAGKNILYLAAYNGDLNFIKYVLEEKKADIDLNRGDIKCGTTLVMEVAGSIRPKRQEILHYLINQTQADVNVCDKNDNTALHYARCEELCHDLIKHGADMNKKNKDGDTPLHRAIDQNFYEAMECLTECGADMNLSNNRGLTPFHLTLYKKPNDWGVHDMCKYLVKHGADVNLGNSFGNTPLHIIIHARQKEVTFDHKQCEYLIRHGAHVDKRNNKGQTPLEYAVIFNRYETCKVLVENGSDVNTRNYIGETPLHKAMGRKKTMILKYLVGEKHADVNVARENDKMTPLHIAASLNDFSACKYLIENGANTRVEDKDGKTPLQWASDERLIMLMQNASEPRNRRSINYHLSQYSPLSMCPNIHFNIPKYLTGASQEGVTTFVSQLVGFFFFVQSLILIEVGWSDIFSGTISDDQSDSAVGKALMVLHLNSS